MVKSKFKALCRAISDFNNFRLSFPKSFHLWQFSACLSFLSSVAIFLKAIRVNSSGHGSSEVSGRLAGIIALISSISVSQSRGFKGVKIRFICDFPPLLRSISQDSPVWDAIQKDHLQYFKYLDTRKCLSEKIMLVKTAAFRVWLDEV